MIVAITDLMLCVKRALAKIAQLAQRAMSVMVKSSLLFLVWFRLGVGGALGTSLLAVVLRPMECQEGRSPGTRDTECLGSGSHRLAGGMVSSGRGLNGMQGGGGSRDQRKMNGGHNLVGGFGPTLLSSVAFSSEKNDRQTSKP